MPAGAQTARMGNPFVYLAGAPLSEAELTAACLDGDLVALGEAFVPADIAETAALRAGSLIGMLGTSLAAVLESAAWVFGAVEDPPARHRVQRAVPTRLHHLIDRRFVYRDVWLPDEDTHRIGGALVSSPGRTAADLARAPSPENLAILRTWARVDPTALTAGRAWLDRRSRVPRRASARALLERLEDESAQDEVTR
jgi:hypothetical protein